MGLIPKKQAAEKAGVAISTITRWANKGNIQSKKLSNGRVMIQEESLPDQNPAMQPKMAKRKTETKTGKDPEICAMTAMNDLLSSLPEASRRRVMSWAQDKFLGDTEIKDFPE